MGPSGASGSISLIAHHLDIRGFTKTQMGSLASWFALGIVALSLPMYTKILTPVPTNFTLNVPGPLNWRSNLLVGTTLVIRPEAVAIGNPCGADKRLH